MRLQRAWRAVSARRAARSQLQLLREYDALMADVRASVRRRAWAARIVQSAWREVLVRRLVAQLAGTTGVDTSLGNELNPFSAHYVGPSAHRAAVEAAEGGRLRARGNPSANAAARALPSQIGTLCNLLRFVDCVNHLLVHRLVEVIPVDEAGEAGEAGEGSKGRSSPPSST